MVLDVSPLKFLLISTYAAGEKVKHLLLQHHIIKQLDIFHCISVVTTRPQYWWYLQLLFSALPNGSETSSLKNCWRPLCCGSTRRTIWSISKPNVTPWYPDIVPGGQLGFCSANTRPTSLGLFIIMSEVICSSIAANPAWRNKKRTLYYMKIHASMWSGKTRYY